MNTRAGDNNSQVASAQRYIMHHYSTELELQQVVELSAVDEEIRLLQVKRTAIVAGSVKPSTSTLELSAVEEESRLLQAKRTAIVAGTVDSSISTPNPNLSAP